MFNWFCSRKEIDRLSGEIDRLSKLAYYDTLTKLPNRLMFHEQAAELMKHSVETNEPLTIFLIDLDNFKNVNDTHGHDIGDQLLKKISTRLNAIKVGRCAIAESVNYYKDHVCQCIAARLGGDEFVMMFEHMDKHEAALVAAQTITAIKEPVYIEDAELVASASLGISIYPWDATDCSKLLKAADLAMYTAKERGKDKFEFYKSSMNTKIERRVETELAIREMIELENVELHFQPIFGVVDEKVVGCEALLRTPKGATSVFHPTELISVAEESNLIIPLGRSILEKACEFGVKCLDSGYDIVVSVNVSSPQLADPNFKNSLEAILEKTHLPPTNLVLEITETILISNFEASAETLNELRTMGITISMDDFGKGFSSFNYLQQLPIGKVKIDMEFIQALGEDIKSNEVVKGIVLMADALGMKTCAEGVETKRQLLKLREFGCTDAQGYYKYPALDQKQFLQMLQVENVEHF